MSLRQLRLLALASLALSTAACSSLTEPSTYEVDKDSVIAARAQPEPAPEPVQGAAQPPSNVRQAPLQLPTRAGELLQKRKKGG